MGSKYLCLDCREVYDSSHLNINGIFDEIWCPKTNCHGILFEIDELLIPTIKVLNEKGYITKFCCSGHYTGQHPKSYITFEDDIDIPYVPNGFTKQVYSTGITIESDQPLRPPTYKEFYQICDNAKILLKWAISLPNMEE